MNKLKEKIAYLKLWLTFLVTIVVGSTAWIFNQAGEINYIKYFSTGILIVALGIFIGFLHKKYIS